MTEKERIRQEVLELNKKRDRIDAELKSCYSVLKSHNVGMDEPLVDADGYPRSDIDVHAIRSARNQIITKSNDGKAIMKQIEELLHKYYEMK